MNNTEKLEQAEIEASIAGERIPNHPVTVDRALDIQRRFNILTSGRPIAREKLSDLADRDALLSLEGINKVLSIFMAEPEDGVDL